MCQVSFSEPFLLRRRRDTNFAGTGFSRERPGSATTAGAAGFSSVTAAADDFAAAGAFSNSSYSDFSIRAVSLPRGRRD